MVTAELKGFFFSKVFDVEVFLAKKPLHVVNCFLNFVFIFQSLACIDFVKKLLVFPFVFRGYCYAKLAQKLL